MPQQPQPQQPRKSKIHDVIAAKKKGGGRNGDGDGGGGGGHAVASTLRGKKGLIEYYQLYRFPYKQHPQKHQQNEQQQPIAVAIIKVGNQLDGPVGHVHGGIIALLFDDVMGFACVPLLPYAVTRDLVVRYKKPQPHEQYVQIRVYVDHEKATETYNHTTRMDGNSKQNISSRKTGNKKRRLFLKATCSSLGSSTTPESAPFSDYYCKDDEIVYSTATITMVQVKGTTSADKKKQQMTLDHHQKNKGNILVSRL